MACYIWSWFISLLIYKVDWFPCYYSLGKLGINVFNREPASKQHFSDHIPLQHTQIIYIYRDVIACFSYKCKNYVFSYITLVKLIYLDKLHIDDHSVPLNPKNIFWFCKTIHCNQCQNTNVRCDLIYHVKVFNVFWRCWITVFFFLFSTVVLHPKQFICIAATQMLH